MPRSALGVAEYFPHNTIRMTLLHFARQIFLEVLVVERHVIVEVAGKVGRVLPQLVEPVVHEHHPGFDPLSLRGFAGTLTVAGLVPPL